MGKKYNRSQRKPKLAQDVQEQPLAPDTAWTGALGAQP